MFGNMFEQMQKAQQEMMKMQSELKNKTVEASVGGGKVLATANGNQQIVKVRIDPELMSEDPEFLEDMVVAAVNQALEKSKNLLQTEMSQLASASGLDINNIMKMFQK